MPPTLQTAGTVYRCGAATKANLTPRPGRDTVGRTGQMPGLSTFGSLQASVKGQQIDLALLQMPLRAFADDSAEGGTAGHVTIVPINEAGEVDRALLDEWAATRATDEHHRLTDLIVAAIAQPNVRGPL